MLPAAEVTARTVAATSAALAVRFMGYLRGKPVNRPGDLPGRTPEGAPHAHTRAGALILFPGRAPRSHPGGGCAAGPWARRIPLGRQVESPPALTVGATDVVGIGEVPSAQPRRGLGPCCQATSDVDGQSDLVIEGRRAAPPRHRLHDEALAGELDRPQLGGPAPHRRRAGPRASSRCAGAVRRRGPRRGRCRRTGPRHRSRACGEVPDRRGDRGSSTTCRGRSGAPAGCTSRTGTPCPRRRTSDPQRRADPPDERRRVVVVGGRCAVIEVAVPGEVIRFPRLQPADVLTRTRHHEVAVGHHDVDEVGVRGHHPSDASAPRDDWTADSQDVMGRLNGRLRGILGWWQSAGSFGSGMATRAGE